MSGFISPQQFTSNPQSVLTGDVGGNTMNLLNSGVSPQSLGSVLNGANGGTGGGTDFTSILGNLQQGGANQQAGGNLINQLMGGSMTGQMGQALSGVQNLGNLTGAQGAQQLMGNQGIQQLLGQMGGGTTGANGLAQILQTAMGGGGTGNQVLSSLGQSGIQQVAQQLMQSNPALANMFGQMGATGTATGSSSGGGSSSGSSSSSSSSSGGGTPSAADVANGLTDAMEAIGNNDIVGGITQLISQLTGGGSSGGSSSSSSSSGGANTENENYDLKNKECLDCEPKAPFCDTCVTQAKEIADDDMQIRDFTHQEFIKHRKWIIETYWLEHILPALMLMAEQLSVAGIQQVEMIGTLLDAKHQLETQRLMQQLTAQAHKDYQPSEGMCTFGTTTKSLAQSNRKSDLVQTGLSARMMQRQLLSGDVTSVHGKYSDMRSRVKQFITTYCDKADNANGLEKLCEGSTTEAARRNIDVDFTRNIESRLTLEVDLTPPTKADGTPEDAGSAAETAANPTKDEEDLFALAANLYSNDVVDPIKPEQLGAPDKRVRIGAAGLYLDLRSVYAKRSVAQNSFAALTAMRSEGDTGSAPYTKALMKELGISDTAEIEKILGKKPSYFAQMEVLTKKIYQNPTFYTELYDKPVNVERKGAAIQAIGLMQDRDLYNSLLRSEAVLSVLLETMLMKEQEKVENARAKLAPGGSQ